MDKQRLSVTEKNLVEEVNVKLLLDSTRTIAAQVRDSGSPEEAAAFHYIKQKLESWGLETKLHYHDAYISLPQSGKLRICGQEIPCITHSMAAATGDGGLHGCLIYAGKGAAADYQDLAVTGQIVLIDGLALGGSVKTAQELGARALICINGDYTHQMITSYVWGNPTSADCSLLPRIPVISIGRQDGEWIKSRLIQTEPRAIAAWVYCDVQTAWKSIPSLTAELPGVCEPIKFLLFSGHVDSWHQGAMDNGSANAAMLEVARILSKHRHELKRTVRLAFWSGHSHGRYAGSAWYCDTHFEELSENCFLHVNVDSIGAIGACVLSQANCMAETKELGAGAIRAIAGQELEGVRFGRAGDQSFWGTGTPSLFMGLSEQAVQAGVAAEAFAALFGGGKTGGFGWWWHTTEDTMDKIDPENLRRDCQVYTLAIYRACTAEILPINQFAAVTELEAIIEEYALTANGRVDMAKTLERVRKLRQLVKDAYRQINREACGSPVQALFNTFIMELSRLLIPLNYIQGSRYEHDPALAQSRMPLLAEVKVLGSIALDSDEFYHYKVLLTRRLNQVNYTLLDAIRVTEKLLEAVA